MLTTQFEMLASSFPCFSFGNIPFSKALRIFCFPLRSIVTFLIASAFFSFITDSFGFVDSLKVSISSFNLICCLIAWSSDKSLW